MESTLGFSIAIKYHRYKFDENSIKDNFDYFLFSQRNDSTIFEVKSSSSF